MTLSRQQVADLLVLVKWLEDRGDRFE